MSRHSPRLESISPFRVMEILARAHDLEANGRSIVHMEIGEPDFASPEPVVQAAVAALKGGATGYTPATGLPELRAAIAASYPESVRPRPQRVIVTPGASGALQLALARLIEPGDEVLLADPGYPCYRNLVRLYGGAARLVPVGPQSGYQLDAESVRRHWNERTRAVLLASPCNPAGMLVGPGELARIASIASGYGGAVIADEIYHGLVYEGAPESALTLDGRVFVINSFSKYFGMTGWRVGWLVAPEDEIAMLDRLAQNMFLATSTPGQHAAIAALSAGVRPELERRREEFRRRRDYLLPALKALGFRIPRVPSGAFYLYADCSGLCSDSEAFAQALLEDAGVAIAPGVDFGEYRAREHVRFSYANTIANLEEGVRRIGAWLDRSGRKMS